MSGRTNQLDQSVANLEWSECQSSKHFIAQLWQKNLIGAFESLLHKSKDSVFLKLMMRFMINISACKNEYFISIKEGENTTGQQAINVGSSGNGNIS